MAEKGIDVPFEEIDVFGAENRRPPYSDNNPAGQLPALELDDGTWLVGTREYAFERPKSRTGTATVLLRIHADGRFERLYEVPSGGDTSYPGFVIHEKQLWMTYYPSHEGKTQIYLAKVPLSNLRR